MPFAISLQLPHVSKVRRRCCRKTAVGASICDFGGGIRLSCGKLGSESLANELFTSDDFIARSSDELSLTKGDRVELVERDDDFGDGWYLGRQLTNGATGLFPEGENESQQS